MPATRGDPVVLFRIASGVYRGKVFPCVPDRPLLVGKALEADFTIPDAALAAFHCRISFEPGRGARVKALTKAAHVEVQNVPMSEVLVRPRERFRIGETTIEYLEGRHAGLPGGDPAPFGTVCSVCGLLVPRLGGGRIVLGNCYCCRCIDLRLIVSRVFGRFKVLRKTKSDPLEIVYVAEDLGAQPLRRVSLHVLRAECHQDPRARRRFLSAGLYGKTLDHPAFPRTLEVEVSEARVTYTAERVEWDSIEERSARGETRPLDMAILILLHVIDAIRYARRRSLVVTRLRPGRVLADDAGEVRLVDWKLLPEAEQSVGEEVEALDPSLAGGGGFRAERPKPVDLPPDEPMDDPGDDEVPVEEDEPTRVRSLGRLLVRIATAQAPTKDDTPQDILQRIVKQHGKHRPRTTVSAARGPHLVPAVVGKILARALAPNPVNRYRTLDDLRRDLMSAHQGL